MNCWSTLVLNFVGALGAVLAAFGAQQQSQGGRSTILQQPMPPQGTLVTENLRRAGRPQQDHISANCLTRVVAGFRSTRISR